MTEAKGWNWGASDDDTTPDTFTVEYIVPATSAASQGAPSEAEEPQTPAANGGNTIRFATPPSHIPSGIDLDDEGAPRRYRTVADCINTSEPRELEPDELLLAAAEEPATFKQANADPAWRAAMQEELQSIIDNGTWALADLPPGHRPIGLKWVFKLKKDATGVVVRH
uniref:Reverse transcriptase Ty1/copia-type domain-containing protein n=1 Tax=Arundo donax TaxID=35708 RepID=A0A0A9BBV2_ARUDO